MDKTANRLQIKILVVAVVVTVTCIGWTLYAYADIQVMNDTFQSYGLNVYAAHYTPFTEYVSATSSLVGQSFNNMTIFMKKVGSPTGTITLGVFAPDLSVKKTFGSISASSLTTSYKAYSFPIPSDQSYAISSGDRIGASFPSGSSKNNVAIMTDQTNKFDGTNSFLSYYTTSWQSLSGVDVTMTLGQTSQSGGTGSTGSTGSTGGTGSTGSTGSTGGTGISFIPPANILSVTTNSSRNIPDLGNYTVTDSNDPNPTVTNDSTGNFKVGKTTVTWTVRDSLGQVATGKQLVTVISVSPPPDVNNRVIMINDDDGPRSAYQYGLPILDKYGIKATWFIICGHVGGSDQYYMDWPMVRGLSSDGQDVQAHTMNHLDANHMSQSQLDYEYGQGKRCLINNGTSNIHMAASPFGTGEQNMTVVQTWERYYDMVRSGHDHTWSLNCSQGTAQTDCSTYNMLTGKLNLYNRYAIQFYSHDSVNTADGLDDSKTLLDFITNELHATTANTDSTTIQIPIVLYHAFVKTNTGTSTSSPDGGTVYTSTILFDAEMKYLKDNGFKFYDFNNLKYDANANIFHLQ